MFCSDKTLLSQDGSEVQATPLRCKMWSCAECAPRRRKQLRAEARCGRPNTFITLTVRPRQGEDPDERARALVAAWRTVRRRTCKRYGYASLPFIAVFEKTRAGEPHLHVLCRVKWIDQTWLSDQMAELIAAPIVDIRRISSLAMAISYITKYIAKTPEAFLGTKRYWRSLDYFVPNDTARDFIHWPFRFWVPVDSTFEALIRTYSRQGFSVAIERGFATMRAPPGPSDQFAIARDWL